MRKILTIILAIFLTILSIILLINYVRSVSVPMNRGMPPPPISRIKEILLEEYMKTNLTELKWEREYAMKYLNITHWRGAVEGLGFKDLFWTEEELNKIMEKAVELDREAGDWLREVNASFTVGFLLPPNTNVSYAEMMASVLSKYVPKLKTVKVSVLYTVDRYGVEHKGIMNHYVKVVRAFLSRGLSIRVKTIEPFGWGSVELTPSDLPNLTPEFLERALDATEEAARGEKPKVPNYKMVWQCGMRYTGLIVVENIDFNWLWWFWYKCWGNDTSGCQNYAPEEDEGCDIHYIRWMTFYQEGGSTYGLINFPGCKYARNCGGTCGSSNTLFKGTCAVTYEKMSPYLLLYSYQMVARYTLTNVGGCPYYKYCGCHEQCRYPQMFIYDIIRFP